MFSRTYTHYNLNVNAAIKEKIGTGPLHFLETVSEIQASGPKVTSSSFVFLLREKIQLTTFHLTHISCLRSLFLRKRSSSDLHMA